MTDDETPEAPPAPPTRSLAEDSAANEALAIVKARPLQIRTGSTLGVFMAGTVIGIVGFAVGVNLIACVGAAVIGACIHRLNAAN